MGFCKTQKHGLPNKAYFSLFFLSFLVEHEPTCHAGVDVERQVIALAFSNMSSIIMA
jgi:hypothetical protein